MKINTSSQKLKFLYEDESRIAFDDQAVVIPPNDSCSAAAVLGGNYAIIKTLKVLQL